MFDNDMTDEEYDAMDEYYTNNPPKVNLAKRGGVFTRQRELMERWIRFPPTTSGRSPKPIAKRPFKSSAKWYESV
ncbi:MAG: hypothetical protein LBE74_03155 [Treponema sp.]|jgi:hypothetical protein|nr:hypothetical protein [Treponema sp.]